MAFATQQQLLAVEDVSQFQHLVDINIELQRAESAILRLLSSLWWQRFLQNNPHIKPGKMQANLFDVNQWNNPTIYYALAYFILPKIEQASGVNTRERAAIYHNKWEYDFRHLLDLGINYDLQGTLHQEVWDEEDPGYIRLKK